MRILNYALYIVTAVLLIMSYIKDKKKTKMALKKAWKAFENILPEFLSIIMIVGILLAFINPDVIAKLIGSQSGWVGVIISGLVGAITLIPGFIAFPTAAMVLKNGAGYMQIGAFISTLMMVGIVTAPVEIKYFGKKVTVLRNIISFLFSFLVAYIIGKVVSI
ncbi:permease [Tepidibacter hydrothermalis]|uniref:Permease n=1 Tax=Tepidibacter hydrothermalis TaxID=3036126 RepID=A0ABY8EEU5_9FIRM|nr:permease [Tepidibacter hydrothermalis]WFD09345.1 permease [Tepidibacter hydrothermalis]